MEIYIVQYGDTIVTIAKKFDLSIEKLINDNGLINASALVVGQAIVILHPQKTYTIQQGDTLTSIAKENEVTVMQLIRNNPILYDQDSISPGVTLVITYDTIRDIEINCFTYSFINRELLKRTLPYLTYLSIFNYRIGENGEIITYGDDSDIIKISKDYQTIPLLMISAFSPSGELNIESIYNLLLDENMQDKIVNEMLNLVRSRGFMGINALISNFKASNQTLYLNVLTKLSKSLKNEGYIFIVTINPNLTKTNDSFDYESIDYNSISLVVDRLIFLNNIWGVNNQPPAPISNISSINLFINYITTQISSNIISIGTPLIGYDWELPFVPGSSYANSMSLNSTITLAYDQQVTIYLDEESQTPYYNYLKSYSGPPQNHIVWFIDARTIKALNDVVLKYYLVGSGIWNLTSANQQLWSMINAQFNIVKLPIKY